MKDSLYLVDTSVWLEVLPRGKADSELRQRVDALLAADLVATTGIVRLELLGGARTEAQYRHLSRLLSALHLLPIVEECCTEAAQMGFQMRREGIAVPFTDLLIASVAADVDAVVVHRDRHFNVIAQHLSLKVESHVPA
ncbi:MAG: PIN domain-containing protein, partial [Dehalococcoidia bacterium]|nr:PIN domain-containing protein [Dehalococcoidia bacterium]